MQLTERDILILKLLAFVGFATTPQIRRELFPADKDGSAVRKRLRIVEGAGLIHRRRAEVANPLQSSTMPVWIITSQGLSLLGTQTGEPHYLEQHPPCTRSWQNFCHYACVTDFALLSQKAIAAQSYVKLHGFYFEHTILNPDATAFEDRFKLYTDVSPAGSPKKTICAPDGAMEIEAQGYRRALYIEMERGTDSPQRVIAKKGQGFMGLARDQHWKKHFPHANDFRVLALAPSVGWRDSFRRALRDYKMGSELWLTASLTDLNVDNFLHGQAFYTATDGPRYLVKPAASPVTV